jgi:hypothetical protein
VIPLVCPTTRQALAPATPALVAELQALHARRALRNASGNLVDTPFDGGWLTADGRRFYPRHGAVSDLRPEAAILLTPPSAA